MKKTKRAEVEPSIQGVPSNQPDKQFEGSFAQFGRQPNQEGVQTEVRRGERSGRRKGVVSAAGVRENVESRVRNTRLAGMSYRQQVIYVMQKTQDEANWDVEKDIELQGGNDTKEEENEMLMNYFKHQGMWTATTKPRDQEIKPICKEEWQFKVGPVIEGVGGCWGHNTQDQFRFEAKFLGLPAEMDLMEPFFIQYEKRMEFIRKKMVQEQKYRLRMYALSTQYFNPIKQNKYLERKKNIFTSKDAQTCNCTKLKRKAKLDDPGMSEQSFNCGKDCINRSLNIECTTLSCPSELYCTNRHFQLFQDRLVYPIKTSFKGWGLAAGEFIPKNSFVMQYVGEVYNVDSDLGQSRINQYKNSTCTYVMQIENNEVIDPTHSGNVARFINHSCDPNCQTRKWTILNEVCVGIFTIKDVQENEELTFNYQFDFFKTPFTRCYCGTAKCKGFLGVNTNQGSSSDESDDSVMMSDVSDSNDDSGQMSDSNNSSKLQKELKKQQEQLIAQNPNATVPKDRPQCQLCFTDIMESKQLLICKGPCNRICHYQCAIKQDKSLKKVKNLLKKRKFECVLCKKKDSSTIKRGRKSRTNEKENLTAGQVVNKNVLIKYDQNLDIFNQTQIYNDHAFRSLYDDIPINLLLDRIVFGQIYKVEKKMQRLFKDRLGTVSQFSSEYGKKFQVQQFSDHYTFMFELLKRLKVKIKKITRDTDSLDFQKIFKQFPRIAKDMDDVHRIFQQGVNCNPYFNDQTDDRKLSLVSNEDEQMEVKEQMEDDGKIRVQMDLRDEADKIENQKADHEKEAAVEEAAKSDPEQMLSDEPQSELNAEQLSENYSINNFVEEQNSSSCDDASSEVSETSESELAEEAEDEEERESEMSAQIDEATENKQSMVVDMPEVEEDKPLISKRQNQRQRTDGLRRAKEGDPGDLANRRRGRPPKLNSREIAQPLKLDNEEAESQKAVKEENKVRKHSMEQLHLKKSLHSHSNQKEQKLIADLGQLKEEIESKWNTFIKQNNQVISESTGQILFKPTTFNLNERVFNLVIKNHIDDIECVQGLHIYWEKPWGYLVTMRINSSEFQYRFISQLLQFVTNRTYQIHDTFKIAEALNSFEIQKLKVPKNFLRKLVGYHEKTLNYFRESPHFNIDFYFDEKLLVDNVFQMDDYTCLRIFGKKADVVQVSQVLQEKLENINMKTILVQQIDCTFVLNNVKEIKAMVDPCEVRIKQGEKKEKDLRHPFLYLPNYLRDIILIGTKDEIQKAELKIKSFIRQKREKENYTVNHQLSFLLPVAVKEKLEQYRGQMKKKYLNVQVFFYLPTFPRKHITITLIGPWRELLQAKDFLRSITDSQVCEQYGSFDSFQRTVFHQQIRFTFKSLKRYILEKDIKYLSHWDIVSNFVENLDKKIRLTRDDIADEEIQKINQSLAEPTGLTKNLSAGFSGLQNANSLKMIFQPSSASAKFGTMLKQESNLDNLMDSDQDQDSKTQDRRDFAEVQSPLKPPDITQEDAFSQIVNKVEADKQNQVQHFLEYVTSEDPETCINILFVLSQTSQSQAKNATEEQLELLMDKLKVQKSFVVECLQKVLFDNVLEFFSSLGKQQYHIKYFESSSESERESGNMEEESVHESAGKFRSSSNRQGNSSSRHRSTRFRSRSRTPQNAQRGGDRSSRSGKHRLEHRESIGKMTSEPFSATLRIVKRHDPTDKYVFYRSLPNSLSSKLNQGPHRFDPYEHDKLKVKDQNNPEIVERGYRIEFNQFIPRFGFSRELKPEEVKIYEPEPVEEEDYHYEYPMGDGGQETTNREEASDNRSQTSRHGDAQANVGDQLASPQQADYGHDQSFHLQGQGDMISKDQPSEDLQQRHQTNNVETTNPMLPLPGNQMIGRPLYSDQFFEGRLLRLPSQHLDINYQQQPQLLSPFDGGSFIPHIADHLRYQDLQHNKDSRIGVVQQPFNVPFSRQQIGQTQPQQIFDQDLIDHFNQYQPNSGMRQQFNQGRLRFEHPRVYGSGNRYTGSGGNQFRHHRNDRRDSRGARDNSNFRRNYNQYHGSNYRGYGSNRDARHHSSSGRRS